MHLFLRVDNGLANQVKLSIMKVAADTVTVNGISNEALVAIEAQSQIKQEINQGRISGMRSKTEAIKLMDSGCDEAFPIKCNPEIKYRTFSGVCNNLQNPLWGSASINMRRYIPAQYADGIGKPRGGRMSAEQHCNTGNKCTAMNITCPSCTSDPTNLLPNPRTVSLHFHPSLNKPNSLTHMFTIFGQFLDHDITQTPEHEVENCCHSKDDRCFPIHIPCRASSTQMVENVTCGVGSNGPGPYNDVGESEGENTKDCLPFSRSVEFCNSVACSREQMNSITAFVDASNVYGSSILRFIDVLLDQDNLFMKTSGDNLLPFGPDFQEVAGDERARENPALASLHTLFLREHNRIFNYFISNGHSNNRANALLEARKIVQAEMQEIVFGEYIPVLLGSSANVAKLVPNSKDSYDPLLDPSIKNAFATASFRFGHSMVQDFLELYSNTNPPVFLGSLQLREIFNNLDKYRENGGMNQILIGLMMQRSQSFDRFVNDDLRDFLFANNELNCLGSDLIARNIQRGRDHGLPTYNDFREYCDLSRACSWDEKPEEINEEHWEALQRIYDDPTDIDLFAGGLAENPFMGGVVGATFNCLITEQFQRLKFGDRFFFTSNENPHPFTSSQLNQIQRRRLSDIICDNTDLQSAHENVFDSTSNMISCDDKQELLLDNFLDAIPWTNFPKLVAPVEPSDEGTYA